MSVSERCHDVRAIASEVALGIADGADRARLLDHVAACDDCRTELEQFAILADDLLELAPEHEPPLGFELRALRAISPAPQRRRRLWLRPGAPALVTAVVATTVTSVALLLAFRDDRQLASQYRATLARAHGSAFTAVPLHAAPNRPGGTVFVYRGAPSWVLITVRRRFAPDVTSAELVSRSGRVFPLEGFGLAGGSWGGTLPADPLTLRRLRLLDAKGQVLLSAYLPRDW